MKKKNKSFFKNVFSGLLIIFLSAVLALFFRIFLIASYHIPSDSMKPAIQPGDDVLVSKLIPGPRIFRNNASGFYRIPGIRNIKKNDVLVFNFPFHNMNSLGDDPIVLNSGIHYIKRCVAVPGDIFYIENAVSKVKGFPDSIGNLTAQKIFGERPIEKIKLSRYSCFPHDTVLFNWNVKNFGPLYIPGKGDTILIDDRTIRLYKNLICYETKQNIQLKDSVFYLGEKILKKYVFRKNYYFIQGDQVKDSYDSRFWGLLPEDHIIGKAEIIWKSQDKKNEKYRWKRFFKLIQ